MALGMAMVVASRSEAQCPDGSTPPCAARQIAVAGRPVANPPLDERTWIVMPFDNISNSAEVDWLRNASVNLLYLDMSRWQDIRVVDDERVADLLRDLPSTRGSTMSLQSALGIARRAGAGKLVMGDVLKSGSRMMVTAKVFDVKDGQRTSTVRSETTVQDSVIPMFGKLARQILKVDPPPGSSVGMIGTSSVGAYQAYSRGVQALNRFDIPVAKKELQRAIQLDSSFALAHYKLATALGWFESSDSTRRALAEASWRFSNSLPRRERSLIEAQLWHIRGDNARATELYTAILRADSLDVEAWHGLGESVFHDFTIVRDQSDEARSRVRGDWNVARRAFERVLALDPSYHVAYPHLVDMLMGGPRTACLRDAEGRQCLAVYYSLPRLEGDSLVVELIDNRDTARTRSEAARYVERGMLRRQLARADTISLRWLDAAPGENYAIIQRATLLSRIGRLSEARGLLARVRNVAPTLEAAQLTLGRIEVELKAGNNAEARRIFDSVVTVPAAAQMRLPYFDGTAAGTITLGEFLPRQFGWTFGRLAAAEPSLRGSTGTTPAPLVMRLRRGFARSMIGFPDSLAVVERSYFDSNATQRGAAQATRGIAIGLMFGLNAPRERWLPIDTTLPDMRMRAPIALVRRDTSALRAAAKLFDETSRALTNNLMADTAFALVATEAYLALGDSLKALRTLRRMLDTTLVTSDLSSWVANGGVLFYSAILPRLMLERADLAAALGERAEAVRWYQQLLELWANADPELSPVISRVRKAVATLSG